MRPARRLLAFGRGYVDALNRYADFDGEATWSEFLSFLAVNLSVTLSLALLAYVTGSGFLELIATLYGFGVLIPGLAVTVRKLHALGLSGWWLAAAILVTGVLIALIG